MGMFRMAGSSDGDLTTEESFADALKARFGASEEPEEPAPEIESPLPDDSESGGGDGPSPLPSSPSETDNEPVTPPDPDHDLPAPEDIPPVEPEPDPLAADVDFNELFERHYGTKPTPSQMTSLLSLVDQLRGLNPNQQAALNVILAGQDPFGTPQSPSGPQAPPQAPAPQNLDLDALTDDARAVLEPIVLQQQEILARLQEQETVSARANLAAQEQQIVAGIQAASAAFVDETRGRLTPTDLVLLETRIQQSGQFPFFMRQHNNDPVAAYRALIETMAYSDPQIRAKLTAGPSPADTAAETAAQARQTKASALAAGGQAGNRVSPLSQVAPGPPSDPQAARDWAINEISRATGLPRVS